MTDKDSINHECTQEAVLCLPGEHKKRRNKTGQRSVAALQRSSGKSPEPAWRQSLNPRNLPFMRTRRATTLSRDKKSETSCPSYKGIDGVSFNRDGGGTRFWARPSSQKKKGKGSHRNAGEDSGQPSNR